jgi:NAD(P)-dependent dehydrogenase (short-subunit alcohol dehydrogenase family)
MNKRIVLITGALGGIGEASVDLFIKENDHVVAFDIHDEQSEQVGNVMQRFPDDFTYMNVDCLDEQQIEKAINDIVKAYGKLDVIFNIVGGSGRVFGDGPIDQCTLEGYEKTMDLNVKSQFLLSKHATKQMLKQGYGCIINMASVLGMVGGNKMFGTHAYAASKAAIIGFSRAMATYYAHDGIRVNVIAPGLIETPMSKRAQHNEKIMSYMDEKQPIYYGKNKLGDPYSVARAAVFLAHEQSDFTTGVVLPVDGGWTAQ